MEGQGVIQPVMTFLIAQGPMGIFVLVLLLALYRLWNLYVATQEKRIEEAKESITAMQEYTKSLRIRAEQYKSLSDDHLHDTSNRRRKK